VLRDEPRLERREEQRRGNASEHAPNHQDLVLGGVLGEAAQDVGDAVGDARSLPPPVHPKTISPSTAPTGTQRNRRGSSIAEARGHALLICEGSDDGAEEHGGAEAGDEEAADVALVEAVLAVEVVHVGPLQPVPSCAIRRGATASVTQQTNRHCGPPVQIWRGRRRRREATGIRG